MRRLLVFGLTLTTILDQGRRCLHILQQHDGRQIPQWRDLLLIPWLLSIVCIVAFLSGCTIPQVTAEDRLFLNLSVDFLGDYQLPKQQFAGAPVGGLSAITYDRPRDRFYALSDDRSTLAPARFYTLKLTLDPATSRPQTVEIERVTTLQDATGNPYAPGTLDPEGIALTPTNSVLIASEGVTHDQIPPFIAEFDLSSGQFRRSLRLPPQYLPATTAPDAAKSTATKSSAAKFDAIQSNAIQPDAAKSPVPRLLPASDAPSPQGVQDNLGFEGLTLNPLSAAGASLTGEVEPFRLFAITESALIQDIDPATISQGATSRMLHYQLDSKRSLLIAEHAYPIDLGPLGSRTGVSELLAIDQGGHFLTLERSFAPTGFSVKLYQITPAGASDTSGYLSLTKALPNTQPVRKELLLDLSTLGIPLDNLEGMTLGPQLPDGSHSLLLVSDDNFRSEQVTQFLLFRLRGLK
jgi:hypothetical protein